MLSDGNHHMALEEALALFVLQHPEVGEVFYSTTPPRVMTDIARVGAARIGNLQLTIKPDIFIGPPAVLNRLIDENLMHAHALFARSVGNVLLAKKGNPKKSIMSPICCVMKCGFFYPTPTQNPSATKCIARV